MFSNKNYNKQLGSIGENIAKEYLIKQGYKIIARNYKTKFGEVDIIAYDEDVLVFIEVKYRKTLKFGLPREVVDYNKQRKIRLVATSYINKYKLFDKVCRFDVIEILDREITLIKDCF